MARPETLKSYWKDVRVPPKVIHNLRMAAALKKGDCLDVRREGREISDGVFELKQFVDGADYCDTETEKWIWSIGKRVSDGVILASYSTEFYLNKDFECLFLR